MSMDIFRSDALAGKSILETGGGGGLGKEISKALVAKGAAVHICGRRAGVLHEPVSEIGACGSAPVSSHVCDIRDADHVDAMMEAVSKAAPLTGLVDNAAATFIAPTKDLGPRVFRAIASTVMGAAFDLPSGEGQDGVACDDHVACRGMGAPEDDARDIRLRLLAAEALEALRRLEEGGSDSADDADVASILGLGFSKRLGGVRRGAEDFDLAEAVALCRRLAGGYGERFAPSRRLIDLAASDRALSAYRKRERQT